MTSAVRTVALVLLAVLAGWGWLRFVHDPAVRARAALEARDTVVDSMVRAWRDSVQAMTKRDSVARDSLTREVERQRRRKDSVRVYTDVVVKEVEDSAVRARLTAALREERARSDSLHRADSALAGLLRGQVAARDALLRGARVTIDSLTAVRDDWRRAARRSPIGLGCTVGPVVSTTGFAPAGIACGLTLRF